uniref:Uncharacterized protein n=1 Tax=Utricularia reniformis TaxID=192314 RepID=A0A1Y0B3F4_9LAMI|nr:hypothetical protein AEK19_MT1767 [Utricularia reniformis]ART31941.1 hypothetical protein AEK19_MT1767 [Utricularia reniformis]
MQVQSRKLAQESTNLLSVASQQGTERKQGRRESQLVAE